MLIEINERVKAIINGMPHNITFKNNAVKIYGALYLLSKRKNKYGYFSVPSEYLVSINKRYSKIIKCFEDGGLIESYKRPVQDEKDIFNTKLVRYYDVNKGICMKYKFLFDVEGEVIDVDMITNKKFRWYDVISNSLLEAGFNDFKISRDSFGRRVHHAGIRDYKEDFRGYWSIDAVASQPRLLWLDMKASGVIDVEYNDIFEKGRDFYLELQNKLNLLTRDEAKELFMFWINGKGYVPDFNIHNVFPKASKWIKDCKSGDYKSMASRLQRMESKIWIDGIMNEIPCEWALPIHDCVIIKECDVHIVWNWIRVNYPELELKKNLLK